MKPFLMASLLAMSLPAAATPPVPTLPDLSKATPVASPNRQSPATAAWHWRRGLEPDTSRAAVRLKDADGRVLGRFNSDTLLLLVYRKQLLTVELGRDFDEDGNIRSGGFSWGTNDLNIYYESTDCSGPGLLIAKNFGTALFGKAISDQGKHFLFIGDARQATRPDVRSVYSSFSKECFGINGFPLAMTPIYATIEVDAFATPPFFLF